MAHVQPEILESFKLMWNLYPSPVFLVHKDRDILATNKAAQGLGINAGIKCHSLCENQKVCPGCKANVSLKKNEGVRQLAFSSYSNMFMDGYWIPVDGVDDVYVHFGNDITEYVKPELLEGQK
ncbi:hypothetical protein [Pseudodesulfovibrio piezophilus]|uniref:PAS domain-containing protein n=1 Tax=Pseudodesulfovibrio piezophilus (strain DSM 21447 / JCM 15486 / C1TLV30) TaxID=1322246 RepID=M1WU60_PSEP2|nr:hypothetical protein [Pseudodesulfovibrio piezophilus]CCH50267.1 conserved protein of unknown function [Pseudodesulfovibrio piezophilus C1TLV30]